MDSNWFRLSICGCTHAIWCFCCCCPRQSDDSDWRWKGVGMHKRTQIHTHAEIETTQMIICWGTSISRVRSCCWCRCYRLLFSVVLQAISSLFHYRCPLPQMMSVCSARLASSVTCVQCKNKKMNSVEVVINNDVAIFSKCFTFTYNIHTNKSFIKWGCLCKNKEFHCWRSTARTTALNNTHVTRAHVNFYWLIGEIRMSDGQIFANNPIHLDFCRRKHKQWLNQIILFAIVVPVLTVCR